MFSVYEVLNKKIEKIYIRDENNVINKRNVLIYRIFLSYI